MGVPPWELAKQPVAWRNFAEASMGAESLAGMLQNALRALAQLIMGG